MLQIEKLKKVKGNFPVLVGSNIIPKNICKKLIKEISKSKSLECFDSSPISFLNSFATTVIVAKGVPK